MQPLSASDARLLPDAEVSMSEAPPVSRSEAGRTLGGGLLFLALGGAGWLLLGQSEALFGSFLMPADPGPFALPRACLWVVLIGGMVMTLVGGVRLARAAPRPLGAPGMLKDARRHVLPVLFLATVALAPGLMTATGTVPAVALFTAGWVAALGLMSRQGTARRLVLRALLCAAGAAIAVEVLAFRLLALPLPQ